MARGFPAGRVAYAFILSRLLEQDLGFEELVAKLKGQLSRGTVDKYLNILYESKDEFKGFVHRYGRRGKYYIPMGKRSNVRLFLDKEVAKERYKIIVDGASPQELEKLLEDSRKLVAKQRERIGELERMVKLMYAKLKHQEKKLIEE